MSEEKEEKFKATVNIVRLSPGSGKRKAPSSKMSEEEYVDYDDNNYVDGMEYNSEEDEYMEPKKRREKQVFDPEVEEDLVQWYKDHPMFYSKACKDFKNLEKKGRLLREKAQSLNPPISGEDLRVWFQSLRSMVGRLSLKAEHDPERELTDRESWVLKAFDFLLRYIKRQPSRRGPKRHRPIKNKANFSYANEIEYIYEDDIEQFKDESQGQSQFENGVQFTTPTAYKVPRVVRPTSTVAAPYNQDDTLMEIIGEASTNSSDASTSKKVHMVQIDQEDSTLKAKKHFTEMVYHECVQMDTHNWDEFQKQCFQLLMHFKQQSREYRQQQQHY